LENGVLRKIFGFRRDELHGLHSSPNIIRVIKIKRKQWVGKVACMKVKRGAYRDLVGRPEEKIPLGRPRRRWEDNIKMNFQDVG